MALQNLRDKLLKAGLVDKKQKQQADSQDRHDKKQKGIERLTEEEAEKQRLFAERQAAEAEAQRQKEAERAEERAAHELLNRVRNICDRWAVRSRRPGTQRFYFAKRSNRIGHLMVGDEFYDQLLSGALAIVERLSKEDVEKATDDTHVLLPPEAAERVHEIDATAIRFWARSQQPIGFAFEPASKSS